MGKLNNINWKLYKFWNYKENDIIVNEQDLISYPTQLYNLKNIFLINN